MPKIGRISPCAECPWLRRSRPGHLGGDTPLHFYRTSIVAETEMPCHMQIDYSDSDWRETQLPTVDYCAGNLIYFRNHLKVPRKKILASAVHAVAPSKHVFAWATEWFAHHAPNQDATELAMQSHYMAMDDENGGGR